MTLILGIDDAGRGPVLGPMVLCGVLANKSDEKQIKELGARDSKELSRSKRNEIKEELTKKYKYHIEQSSPKEIDDSTNLNYLEARKAATIINVLTKDIEEKVSVVIDCPSTNIKKWCDDVKHLLENPKKIRLSCEHKADQNHPIVSAASILAKEKREEEMKLLRRNFQIDFGSGYPADPKTKEFISENFDNATFNKIIRFSWNTVKKLVKEKESGQKKLF
jgi:ribonuclease HII